MKIELKRRCIGRHISLLVQERKTELNYLQQVNVALEALILVVDRFRIADNLGYHTREFGILFKG
jgi:outer membrane protease